jgi:hypothetical protein
MGLTFSITSVYLMDISSPAYRGILGVFPPLLTQVRRPSGFRDILGVLPPLLTQVWEILGFSGDPRVFGRSSGFREILGFSGDSRGFGRFSGSREILGVSGDPRGFGRPRSFGRSSGFREILGSFSSSTHLGTTFSPFLTQVPVPPVILSIPHPGKNDPQGPPFSSHPGTGGS